MPHNFCILQRSALTMICLLTGWHNVELRYSKSPLDTTSVFKFFVIEAQEVQTTYNSGVPSNQILWKVTSLFCSLSS